MKQENMIMPKYTIDEIFKSPETKHSLGLFDKKLISSINLYEKINNLFKDATNKWKGVFNPMDKIDLLNDEKDLEAFHKFWLQSKSAQELSYPIFMATSQKSGKDNSGEYVYKKNENGELMLDEHGHLIVDHDLDYIADKFVEFARKQGFDFWRESYRFEATKPAEIPLAAEGKTKYGKSKTR